MAKKDKARVKCGSSFKINMGNYENVTVYVGVELEGDKDDIDGLWEEAEAQMEEQLTEQFEGLKEHYSEQVKNSTIVPQPGDGGDIDF